jgi:hypothetical protein
MATARRKAKTHVVARKHQKALGQLSAIAVLVELLATLQNWHFSNREFR